MREQLRAVCPACFATQALTNHGGLVQHGYKRPQHWHQNVGTCTGTGQPHFGTPAGRDYTAHLAKRLRDQADKVAHTATEVLCGRAPVFKTKRVASGVVMPVQVENPTQHERDAYASRLRYEVDAMRRQATDFEQFVTDWKPAEPTRVQVEAKQTMIHWRTARRWGGRGKACAGSVMGSMRGHTTSEFERVTCDKCKRIAAHYAAQEK